MKVIKNYLKKYYGLKKSSILIKVEPVDVSEIGVYWFPITKDIPIESEDLNDVLLRTDGELSLISADDGKKPKSRPVIEGATYIIELYRSYDEDGCLENDAVVITMTIDASIREIIDVLDEIL